jgi:DNA-binding beta-propeller fold protein YncE
MNLKKHLVVIAAITLSAPSVAGDEPDSPGYGAEPDWMTLPAGQQTIGQMHGDIAVAKDGRVLVSVEGGPNTGVQIYSADGQYQGNLEGAPDDLHGFVLHTAKDGREYLYGASLNGQRIVKISLDGNTVLDIDAHATIPTEYHGPTWSGGIGLLLTGTAVSADDHIYVVDGYGRDIIHHLDENGTYVRSFGGKDDPWYFNICHKIIFDTRFTPELLTCADRENGRLLQFDVAVDTPVREIYSVNFRRPAALAVKGELMAVAEILGRISLIDRDGKTLATLGTNTNRDQIATPIFGPDVWQPGVLQSPHGVAFDNDGNVLVAEWNEFGRVVLFRAQR